MRRISGSGSAQIEKINAMLHGLAHNGLDFIRGRFANAAQTQPQHAEFLALAAMGKLPVLHKRSLLQNAFGGACYPCLSIIAFARRLGNPDSRSGKPFFFCKYSALSLVFVAKMGWVWYA